MDSLPRVADGPSPAALGGAGPAAALRRAFLATRPKFYTASVLPVLVGTAWAATAHQSFDGWLFALALLATVLAHGFTNVYNDVADDANGTDPANTTRIYPYTGGSRFIQNEVMTRAEMLRLALVLGAAALAVGVVLTLLRGWGVMVLGLIGLAIGWLYSKPGVQLSGRGVGELVCAIGLGALPVCGAAWLQSGVVDAGAVLLAVMVSVWVALILFINEVPDAPADALAGKRTLAVRFGAGGVRTMFVLLTALATAAGALLLARGALPLWYGVPLALLALGGLAAARGISAEPARREQLRKSIELTLAVHALGSVSLVVAILLAGLLASLRGG